MLKIGKKDSIKCRERKKDINMALRANFSRVANNFIRKQLLLNKTTQYVPKPLFKRLNKFCVFPGNTYILHIAGHGSRLI